MPLTKGFSILGSLTTDYIDEKSTTHMLTEDGKVKLSDRPLMTGKVYNRVNFKPSAKGLIIVEQELERPSMKPNGSPKRITIPPGATSSRIPFTKETDLLVWIESDNAIAPPSPPPPTPTEPSVEVVTEPTAWDKFKTFMTDQSIKPIPNGVWVGIGIAVISGVGIYAGTRK
ncbi:MAG: hypothetical protein A2W25_04115 [candidate division Zixibacteria bacterium RBG_16_53_22]|nr:MAG: hypothetical protein A2W25_04115 [candidate division Zixibacteria bacterium RBG_16_53_22]